MLDLCSLLCRLGFFRSLAEDLRGFLRVAGQRRFEPPTHHHDPQVPAVFQALQPEDQVSAKSTLSSSHLLADVASLLGMKAA